MGCSLKLTIRITCHYLLLSFVQDVSKRPNCVDGSTVVIVEGNSYHLLNHDLNSCLGYCVSFFSVDDILYEPILKIIVYSLYKSRPIYIRHSIRNIFVMWNIEYNWWLLLKVYFRVVSLGTCFIILGEFSDVFV